MGLINLSSLTLNPEEARESSQAVFEKVFEKSALNTYYNVMTGITMKTQIPFYGRFEPYLLADPGSCGVNSVSQEITPTQKYWEPELLSGRFTHCQGSLADSLFKMWRAAAKANPDYWETIDNEQIAFLEDRITDAMYEDILLKVMFGDEAAANVSGGGNITNGENAALFTPFNGHWQEILVAVAAGDTYRYTISENAAASKAAQAALASTTAIDAMRDLYNNSDSRIFQSELKFQMTRSLYNNYRDYLETQSLGFEVDRTEEGTSRDSYRGIPIIIRDDWDRHIKTYFDQGTTYLDPHRMWLSDNNNVPVGTLSETDLDSLDAFYHRKDKKHYIDTALTLDAKMLEEYMISVAY